MRRADADWPGDVPGAHACPACHICLLPAAEAMITLSGYRQDINVILHVLVSTLAQVQLMMACAAAGALHTHGSLAAHVGALVDAWAWHQDDRILHALPLHHVHGVINALHCAHAVGAAVEFLPKFSPADVWRCLAVRASLAAYTRWDGGLLTAQTARRGCELGREPVQSVWQQVVAQTCDGCPTTRLLDGSGHLVPPSGRDEGSNWCLAVLKQLLLYIYP